MNDNWDAQQREQIHEAGQDMMLAVEEWKQAMFGVRSVIENCGQSGDLHEAQVAAMAAEKRLLSAVRSACVYGDE